MQYVVVLQCTDFAKLTFLNLIYLLCVFFLLCQNYVRLYYLFAVFSDPFLKEHGKSFG
jgi:hypothetical protein